jgi:hypothetical protein
VSAKKSSDPRGGHVRLHWTLIDSQAWHAISHTEQALYVAMRRQYKGSNNGDVSATRSTMLHFGFTSPATLSKSLRSLMVAGFIAKTRDTGGLTHRGAVCCLYRFTDEPCNSIPSKGVAASKATHDYLRWKTLADAKGAIARAHLEAKRPNHPNSHDRRQAKLQPLKHVDSTSEASQFNQRTVPLRDSPISELCQPVAKNLRARANARDAADSHLAPAVHRHASESEHLYRLPSKAHHCFTAALRASLPITSAPRLLALQFNRPPAYHAARARLPFNAPPFN